MTDLNISYYNKRMKNKPLARKLLVVVVSLIVLSMILSLFLPFLK